MLKCSHAGKLTNKPPIPFKALCIYDHLGTWPVLFSGNFFMLPGLMTSFNVSIVPIYSFFYQLNWLLLLIAQKYLKTPQTSSFPKYRSGSELCCLSSKQSGGIFFSSSCHPVQRAAEWEKERLNFYGQIHSLLEWLLPLFSPLILSYKSRCIWVCLNWFIACLSWKTLQVLEYAKNTSFLKSFASSGGVSSFPPDFYLLVVLWPAMLCAGWFKCIKGWSWIGIILLSGGEKIFATSLVLDQTSWLLKKTPAFSDHLVSHSFEFDTELKKCQSLHIGLAGIATWNFCAYTSDLIANTTNPFLT